MTLLISMGISTRINEHNKYKKARSWRESIRLLRKHNMERWKTKPHYEKVFYNKIKLNKVCGKKRRWKTLAKRK